MFDFHSAKNDVDDVIAAIFFIITAMAVLGNVNSKYLLINAYNWSGFFVENNK